MELQDKDKMVGSRVLQCLARLERRRRKTLTLGRDPWKGCQQHRSSRGLGRLRDTHVTPHEGTPPHGVNPENSRKGPRGDLELSGRRSGCSPFPTRPAPPRPAVTGVPTGWDSDHGRVPTFAEAPCGDHVTDGFLAATPPSLKALVPPRAPALRLRRRLSLAAGPRHDVTPSKVLKLQLATGRSGWGWGWRWGWEESLSAEQSSGAVLRRLLICLARVCGCCSNQPLSLQMLV